VPVPLSFLSMIVVVPDLISSPFTTSTSKPLNSNVVFSLAGASISYIPKEAKEEMAKKGFDLSQLDFNEIIKVVDEELVDGKLVDVDVDDPNEGRIRVEVYVE